MTYHRLSRSLKRCKPKMTRKTVNIAKGTSHISTRKPTTTKEAHETTQKELDELRKEVYAIQNAEYNGACWECGSTEHRKYDKNDDGTKGN